MILLTVFLPILASLAVLPLKRSRRACEGLTLAVSAAVLALSLHLVLCGGAAELSGFCSLGASFTAESFHGVLALISAFLFFSSALASPAYFARAERTERYFSFFLLTLGAISGVFYAGDFGTLFLFFEMMSMASYVWVAQNETPDALRAAETYLYIAVIGGLVLLMGLFLLYANAGTLRFEALVSADMSPRLRLAAGLCMLVGFGAKAGMFPLHIWLPKAHPVAPAPASALLSGILTKSGVFGVILVTCFLTDGDAAWGRLLLALATVTMVTGAVLAVFSVDLKRTLACSSMSQIGFILVGVAMRGLLGEEGGLAAYGATLHMLNHSLIKLTLFVAAGVLYCNTHTLDLNRLRGTGRGKPLLCLAFLSGACSIAGIPGFGGYVSKTLLHESIVEYAEELAAHGGNALPYTAVEWLFLFSGGLTFAYMARLFYILFLARPASEIGTGRYTDLPTKAVLAVGGLAMPLLGLTPHGTMEGIAHAALAVFRTEAPRHTVHYFAFSNLKGACISVSVGLVVLFAVGFGWLTRRRDGEELFRNVWNEKLDLENAVYRPLLRLLSLLGALAARLVERLGTGLIYGAVDLLFFKADEQVVPAENDEFGRYGKRKERLLEGESFSSDLLFALGGLAAIFLFILLHG